MHVTLGELTREDVHACAAGAVAVVPVGSTEQHGPHLPLLTDTLLVEAVLDAALPKLAESATTFVVARTLPVGFSDHHLFATAVSARVDTLRALLTDVCDSLVGSGFTRIALVNGHGGNEECVSLAVKELVLRRPVCAAACSYWSLLPQGRHGKLVPGHAGWMETSMMLAAHPELVRTDERPIADPQPPPLFDQREIVGLVAQRSGEWARVGGVTDPAQRASAEDGRRLLDEFGGALSHALEWFADNADLPTGIDILGKE